MSYVDAFFDRDSDIIRVVERKDDKRHFHEYQAKYTFYYKDERGKYKSVFGDPLTRIVCKNTKDFRKEVAINKGKELFDHGRQNFSRSLQTQWRCQPGAGDGS